MSIGRVNLQGPIAVGHAMSGCSCDAHNRQAWTATL